MVVVVVPLLQEGCSLVVLGVQLGAHRRPPALLLLLGDIDLSRERAAESGDVHARARVGRHRGEAMEESRVDGGRDAGVEAVRLRALQGVQVVPSRVGRSWLLLG